MNIDEKRARLAALRDGPAPKEKESRFEDFGEGVVASGLETYYGIKDLVTDLDDDDRATLKDWKDDASESGWGTAGQVVGEVMQMAVPGGVALKGARGLSKAMKIAQATKRARALAVGSEMAVAGGHGATKLPGEYETRTSNGLMNAAAGALGAGAIGAGKKAVRGLRKTAEAQKILAKGGYLTPGQASLTTPVKGIENWMSVTPFIAKGTIAARTKGVKEWGRNAVNEVSGALGFKQTGSTAEDILNVKKLVKGGYQKAWSKSKPITQDTVMKVGKVFQQHAPNLADNIEKKAFKGILIDMQKVVANGGQNAKVLSALDKRLNKLSAGNKSHAFMDALSEAKQVFRADIGAEATAGLKYMDNLYPKWKALQQASVVARTAKRKFIEPDDILKGAKDSGSKGKLLATGEAPLQGLADEGLETVGQANPNILPIMTKALSPFIPTPLPLKTMGNTILGNTAPQKALQKAGVKVSPYADQIRKMGLSPTTASAAYSER